MTIYSQVPKTSLFLIELLLQSNRGDIIVTVISFLELLNMEQHLSMYTQDPSFPNTIWILVANSSEAKLYKSLSKDLCPTNLDHISLELVESLVHSKSREKDSELVSDHLGRYANKGLPRSAFAEPTDPHQHEIDQFAKQLADLLDRKRKENLLQALILICPARFYGQLNTHLSKQTTQLISHVLKKDYTKEPEGQLIHHLKDALSLK